MRTWSMGIALAVMAGVAATAQAADKPSVKQLIADGYEIKAITLLTPETLKQMNFDPGLPQVMVTLQKGQALAACQFAVANWTNMAASSIEGTTQCDVYPK